MMLCQSCLLRTAAAPLAPVAGRAAATSCTRVSRLPAAVRWAQAADATRSMHAYAAPRALATPKAAVEARTLRCAWPSASVRSKAWRQQMRTVVTIVRKPEEPEEADVFKAGEPSIILTERAEEKLKQVSEAEQNPNLALRIAVEPGGCHGYQYKMELTDEAEDDDFHFRAADGVTLYIDSVSLNLVKGSTIDYVTELIGSQFAIKDNPQAKGAGCGCGVSWEPII